MTCWATSARPCTPESAVGGAFAAERAGETAEALGRVFVLDMLLGGGASQRSLSSLNLSRFPLETTAGYPIFNTWKVLKGETLRLGNPDRLPCQRLTWRGNPGMALHSFPFQL